MYSYINDLGNLLILIIHFCSCSIISHAQLCNPMDCSTSGFPVLHYLPVCSNSCPLSWWCHPIILSLSSSSSPALNISQHQGLFNELSLPIRWPKYWSFSFSISSSSEYSGLISFRIDWFDLLAVQETLKNLLQHHNSKAAILRPLTFQISMYT